LGIEVAQPVAFGLVRPAIVLPERFAEAEPAPRVESALAHEWAHVKNGDLRHLALSRVLLPLFFAHPLFVWLRRRVRADQEALADLAASHHGGPIAYAETLLNWARSGEARGIESMVPALGLWDRPSVLHHRIALLLDSDTRLETDCSPRWRLAVGALTVACLVGFGGVALGGPIVDPFDASHDGSSRSHRHTHASGSLVHPNVEAQAQVGVLCCPPKHYK
jgi:beta-lactamase regulating signal transducer with metallopeptidase domain